MSNDFRVSSQVEGTLLPLTEEQPGCEEGTVEIIASQSFKSLAATLQVEPRFETLSGDIASVKQQCQNSLSKLERWKTRLENRPCLLFDRLGRAATRFMIRQQDLVRLKRLKRHWGEESEGASGFSNPGLTNHNSLSNSDFRNQTPPPSIT